jgi:hypothetical protein
MSECLEPRALAAIAWLELKPRWVIPPSVSAQIPKPSATPTTRKGGAPNIRTSGGIAPL